MCVGVCVSSHACVSVCAQPIITVFVLFLWKTLEYAHTLQILLVLFLWQVLTDLVINIDFSFFYVLKFFIIKMSFKLRKITNNSIWYCCC